MNWRRRGPWVLSIVIFLLLAPGARSARVDCGPLLKAAASAGLTPTLYLDPDYGITRLESGADYCLEPIEEWRLRHLSLKSSGKPPRPQPEADESPAPAPAAPAAAPKKTAPPAPPPPRPIERAEPCDRNIGEFWRGTLVDVRGVTYSLVRVYTIDLDSNNRVDDVGFRLQAQGKPDLAISYLRGDLTAATLPELQLSDEGVIERLCFETQSFEMLKTSSQGMPDLAADLKSRMKIKATPKTSKPAKEAEPVPADDEIPLWMWAILGLSVLMLGGGGAAWFFLLRGDDEDEDDDDDEEEEDDD